MESESSPNLKFFSRQKTRIITSLPSSPHGSPIGVRFPPLNPSPISSRRRNGSDALFSFQTKEIKVPLFPRSPYGAHRSYNNKELHFEKMKNNSPLIRYAKERSGRFLAGTREAVESTDNSSSSVDESEKLNDVAQLTKERMRNLLEIGDLLYGPRRALKQKKRM